jgi:hypothetical protein
MDFKFTFLIVFALGSLGLVTALPLEIKDGNLVSIRHYQWK